MRSGPEPRPGGRSIGARSLQPSRAPERDHVYDRSGPNIKLRGNPHQLFERYVALAREAAMEGDRVAAENFYQHAEHYFRVTNPSRESDPPEAA